MQFFWKCYAASWDHLICFVFIGGLPVVETKYMQVVELETRKQHIVWRDFNAHQLSFYWEGDLRILSYFLNKRKELEFKLKYCWPSIFDERESATNNRITDKLSVLRRKWGIIHSLKILRRTRKLRVLLVRIWNACLTHFRCSCQDDTFMTKNALIFFWFFWTSALCPSW